MRFIIVFKRKDVCIMFTKEKFEEMDNFIRDFENISDEDRSKFFNKVMNKCLCIEKTKMAIECYRNILSIIKKAVIDNTDIEVILSCIDKFDSLLEDESNGIEEKLKYHIM